MIFPIRCFSCGKPIAHLWEDFKKRKEKEKDLNKVFKELKIKRYCCKQVFMGHIDTIQIIGKFRK
ncbi:MAG TPA: DNA-directed RNA polymerase subunit N [Nautiliaceae bacterium]|nr:DNA-directed RNA polymerase subunit N [Nautiliaceae bacterium]